MKMKDLQKVAEQLPINSRLKPNILGIRNDNVERLYQLLKKGKVTSDEEVIERLLSDSNYPRRSIWKLKTKLIERMGNSLITSLDALNIDTYQKKHIYGYYLFVLLKISIALGINSLIESFGKKIMKIAVEYHITELCILVTIYLRRYFLIQQNNIKEYAKYNKLNLEYHNQYIVECELDRLYNELALIIRQKKSFNQKTIKISEKIYKSAITLSTKGHSYKILVRTAYIESTYLLLKMEYKKVCLRMETLQAEIAKLPFSPFPKQIFVFEYRKIPWYIISKKFNQANNAINNCFRMTPVNSYNYKITTQILFLNLFHQGKFAEANSYFNMNFSKTRSYNEAFEIYHAYASILTGNYFRAGRFLNQVPIFSKDKKGMNINILIILILDNIRKKLYSKVIDQTESLSRYINRYLLDEESTFRSRHFLLIIKSLEKGAFQKKEVLEYVQPHLKALEEHPLSEAKQDYEVEVVPYEKLWDFIYNNLQ